MPSSCLWLLLVPITGIFLDIKSFATIPPVLPVMPITITFLPLPLNPFASIYLQIVFAVIVPMETGVVESLVMDFPDLAQLSASWNIILSSPSV